MLFHLTIVIALLLALTAHAATPASRPVDQYSLDFTTPTDPTLQSQLEKLDTDLRARFDIKTEQAAAGILDLKKLRLAMLHPDRIEYAASVPKIGIMLAWFHDHPDVAKLDPKTRHQLGLMIKGSNNEIAAKFSNQLGLQHIQDVIEKYQLYDPFKGGGIWVGKHYGKSKERRLDPVGDHSHAATVRQLLRFYLLLEQGKLVSPQVCETMKQIFASPDIPHDQIKFVKALHGRDEVKILRKWGTWENWHHDTALITGPNRHYILVALTNHPKGDAYLEALATALDDLLRKP
jgi:beta-lactamase class A